MATRWPQDGLLERLLVIWVARWPQDGAKRVLSSKKSILPPPMLGPKLGPNFSNFWHQSGLQEASRSTWMTCCVKTPIFKRKWLARDTLWTQKIQPKCCTVVKNQGFRSSNQSGSWKGSWDLFWDDFGTQVEAKLGHVGHQVGLQWLTNITPKIRRSKGDAGNFWSCGFTQRTPPPVP